MAESVIPVIDFADLGLHHDNDSVSNTNVEHIGKQIKDAFSTTGFCYLTNHGVSQELVEDYMRESRNFFEQPQEEKMKFCRSGERIFGYIACETEHTNPERPGDLKEAFNYLPHQDPDNWPESIQGFQKTSQQMCNTCTVLGYRVLDALSVGMGLGKTFMTDAHKHIGTKQNATTIRSLYYPPLSSDTCIKPGQIRHGEHSDFHTITLLFQDNVGGLEVNIPGKGFVPATPIPGTIVLNIGDLMQRWTADSLLATKHRVVIPKEETKKKQVRQSAAFFVQPDDDYVIECLDGSGKYEPVTNLDYIKLKFADMY